MSKSKNNINKNMILVEAGRFEMGEKTNTKLVTISKDFYICKYPVTFADYDEYCNDNKGVEKPNDENWGRGDRPVINVDWYNAIEYCNWKSRKENGLEEVYAINKSEKDKLNISRDDIKWTVTCDFNKNGYRLPTESEWEFATRGGNESKEYFKYSGSNVIDKVSWYLNNSKEKTHTVGEKIANELGIYDMSGNVYEWCWDWYKRDYTEEYDPKGAKSGSGRVARGGGWGDSAVSCGVALRDFLTPSDRSSFIGFRVSRTC